MYKTIRVAMFYDKSFEESFKKARKNYDAAYKHAIGWFYDSAFNIFTEIQPDLKILKNEIKNAKTKNKSIEKQKEYYGKQFTVVNKMLDKYDAFKILTKFRAKNKPCSVLLQRSDVCELRKELNVFSKQTLLKKLHVNH